MKQIALDWYEERCAERTGMCRTNKVDRNKLGWPIASN